ncbi:hypothetical protein MPF19_08895 [Polaribacter sp. Z014]|uniref:tetratricopeptide repeat protein n=1 Tax=unclassified Polaribacter TaxID=196858 RepID=UPI00193C7F0E|nr:MULTISPECIES: hypothetical protein [unclassified Polaribacter]MCL7763528.1 hypothetical protein [Polaribacter sp. Z014]QVY66698.1 hypothetical protein JOP69_05275 [Polaribacter sp. Q13]
MKYLITLFIIIGLASCKNAKKANSEYNRKAVELNNNALKLSIDSKKDSALTLYNKAIELDNSYYLPHLNKIRVYLEMKEYEKALYESEMVIKKKPKLAEGWFFAGLLNEHQGNNKKANTYYKKSIKIFTDRINNPDNLKDINANKLNRALSKKFMGDESYLEDFKELEKMKDYSFLVHQFKNKTNQMIMKELIK